MFEPHPVDVAAGGRTRLRLEGAGEVAGREPGTGGERLHGEVPVGVLADPLLEVAQRLPAGGLGGQLGTELGLVAGAAQKDDQMAGDGEGHVPAEVLLDQGERQVDAER